MGKHLQIIGLGEHVSIQFIDDCGDQINPIRISRSSKVLIKNVAINFQRLDCRYKICLGSYGSDTELWLENCQIVCSRQSLLSMSEWTRTSIHLLNCSLQAEYRCILTWSRSSAITSVGCSFTSKNTIVLDSYSKVTLIGNSFNGMCKISSGVAVADVQMIGNIFGRTDRFVELHNTLLLNDIS